MDLSHLLDAKKLKNYRDYLKSTGVPTATIDRKLSSLKKWQDFVKNNYLKKFPALIDESRSEDIIFSAPRFKPTTNPLNNLYQKYTSSRISSYLHLAILMVFTVAMGIFGYNQIFKEALISEAFPQAPNPTTPNRILSFQARLTDSSDTPITTATDMRFILYNDESASGSALLWEELRFIDPDQDGLFSVSLGTETAINSSVFTENADLYLGVTVETDPEATPRQRIASVGYALNAETLQGFPPSASASADQIPVLTQEGDLVIAAASPQIYSSSGTFGIRGQVLAVTTDTGTNGDITISPDGTGQLLLTGSTTTDNFIRVTNANLTSGHLISGYVGNDTATGDLLNLSSGTSETEVFTVGRAGDTYIAGAFDANGIVTLGDGGDAVTIDGSALALQTTGAGSDITMNAVDQIILTDFTNGGSGCSALETDASGNLVCGTDGGGGGSSNWRITDGALSPVNDTLDLLIGSTASTSAKFAFINVDSGTPTASIAGQITLAGGNRNIQTAAATDLILGGNTTGNILIQPNADTGDYFRFTSDATNLTLATTDGSNLTITPAGTLNLNSTGLMTLDSSTDIYLDADGADVLFRDGGVTFATFTNSSTDLILDIAGGDLTLASGDNLNLTASSDLIFGSTTLAETTAANDSGAFVVGTFDEFANSASANVQDVLDDLDASITTALASGGPWVEGAGILYPKNSTVDLLVGGQSTSSAQFAVLNLETGATGVPIASVSSGLSGTSAYLTADGSLATHNRMSLTIGNSSAYDTTGNVLINPNGTGNVGIGESLPGTHFVVGSDAGLSIADSAGNAYFAGAVEIDGTTTLNNITYTWPGSQAAGYVLQTDGSGTLTWSDPLSGSVAGWWREANGAISPINDTIDLLIGSNASASAKFAFINVNSGTPTASISGSSAGNSLYLDGDGTISTSLNRSLLLNAGGGNVGVGTSTPGAKFDAQSSSGKVVSFNPTSGTAGNEWWIDSTNPDHLKKGDNLILSADPENDDASTVMMLYVDGTEKVRIDSNGYVGIGSTAPEALLEVQGIEATDAILALDADDGDDDNDTWFIESEADDNDLSFVQHLTERFKIDTNGYIHSQRFVDLASATYFLDPASTGTSLSIDGNIVSTGAFSITSNGNADITINAGTETVIIGDGGTNSKLDVGTVDPPYTINGEKYATYLSSMIGIKEETTGLVETSEYVDGIGYRHTIDFTSLETGSDLWLFAATTGLKNQMNQMVVLLSPAGTARAWYTLDTINNQLHVYSNRPTTVSYRLTAPRFDAASRANTRTSKSVGFLINDDTSWKQNPDGVIIGDNDFFNDVFDTIEAQLANLVELVVESLSATTATIANLTITDTLISPTVETETLATNVITALDEQTDTISIEASIEVGGDASVAGNLTATTITTGELIADNIKASTIEGLRDRVADLVAAYRDETATASAESDPSFQAWLDALEQYPASESAHYLSANSIEAEAGFFSEYLGVLGQATITNLQITDSLDVSTLTSGTGAINFLAGLMTLDSSGMVTINGNLSVTGIIAAQEVEAPLARFDELLAQNITSTGSATFKEVFTEGLIIAADASASADTASASASITTNATAGKAILPSGATEITINTPHVSADTLTYVTPVGDPQNQVLYVSSKLDNQWFKVALNQSLPYDLEFNWWTIRLE